MKNSLKENKDFRRLYYRGKSEASPVLVTYVMKNRLGFTRVGITSGKKIGNAVKRNRARRVIRAAFAQCEVKMQRVLADMEAHLSKMGVIK